METIKISNSNDTEFIFSNNLVIQSETDGKCKAYYIVKQANSCLSCFTETQNEHLSNKVLKNRIVLLFVHVQNQNRLSLPSSGQYLSLQNDYLNVKLAKWRKKRFFISISIHISFLFKFKPFFQDSSFCLFLLNYVDKKTEPKASPVLVKYREIVHWSTHSLIHRWSHWGET